MIASIVVLAFVGGLIVWSVIRYRKRSDEMPRQFQYHLGIEITYIVIPVVMVLILFGFTVYTENQVDAVTPSPAVKVHVTAFQWGWRYQYPGKVTITGVTTEDPDPIGLNGAPCAPAVDCLGPGLVVPAGQTTGSSLDSQDTIHGFYVPEFNFSRYAQPGVTNVSTSPSNTRASTGPSAPSCAGSTTRSCSSTWWRSPPTSSGPG